MVSRRRAVDIALSSETSPAYIQLKNKFFPAGWVLRLEEYVAAVDASAQLQ
jgi:hypothetical protein